MPQGQGPVKGFDLAKKALTRLYVDMAGLITNAPPIYWRS